MSAQGDAVATGTEAPSQPPLVDITRFEDLDKLGIDERIIQSVTRGMGYDNMTEVQSKTVGPALTGKDMYVFQHASPAL